MRKFFPAIVGLLALFICSATFADPATPVPDPDAMMLWSLVGYGAATGWGYLARWLTGRYAFFHNPFGHALIVLFGGCVAAIAPIVQERGLDKHAIYKALGGAVLTFLGSLGAGPAGQAAAAKKADAQAAPRAGGDAGLVSFWMLLALGLVGLLGAAIIAGCATTGADAARQTEANTDSILGAGYRTVKAAVKVADADAVAKAQAGKDAEAQAELDTTRHASAIVLQILDTAGEGVQAADDAIGAAEAAKVKDYAGIIAQLIKIGGDVVQAFAVNGIKLALPIPATAGVK